MVIIFYLLCPGHVYADDGKNGGEGTLYNVEMQQRDEYNISKRSRYYQSAMDIDALARGVDYSELKNTYIIFICLFDPFGKGRQRYTFTKICEEENEIRLDDGSAVLVLTDRPGEPEINEILQISEKQHRRRSRKQWEHIHKTAEPSGAESKVRP